MKCTGSKESYIKVWKVYIGTLPSKKSAFIHNPCLVCWFKYGSWFLVTLGENYVGTFSTITLSLNMNFLLGARELRMTQSSYLQTGDITEGVQRDQGTPCGNH